MYVSRKVNVVPPQRVSREGIHARSGIAVEQAAGRREVWAYASQTHTVNKKVLPETQPTKSRHTAKVSGQKPAGW